MSDEHSGSFRAQELQQAQKGPQDQEGPQDPQDPQEGPQEGPQQAQSQEGQSLNAQFQQMAPQQEVLGSTRSPQGSTRQASARQGPTRSPSSSASTSISDPDPSPAPQTQSFSHQHKNSLPSRSSNLNPHTNPAGAADHESSSSSASSSPSKSSHSLSSSDTLSMLPPPPPTSLSLPSSQLAQRHDDNAPSSKRPVPPAIVTDMSTFNPQSSKDTTNVDPSSKQHPDDSYDNEKESLQSPMILTNTSSQLNPASNTNTNAIANDESAGLFHQPEFNLSQPHRFERSVSPFEMPNTSSSSSLKPTNSIPDNDSRLNPHVGSHQSQQQSSIKNTAVDDIFHIARNMEHEFHTAPGESLLDKAEQRQDDIDEKNQHQDLHNTANPNIRGATQPNMDVPNFVEIIQEQIDLRLASSNNPTVVMELNLDGTIRYLSRNWESTVGTNIKKLVGKPISDFLIGNSEEDCQVFNNALEQMVRDDVSYKVKFVTPTNDRRQYTIDTHSSGKLTPSNSLNEGYTFDYDDDNDDNDNQQDRVSIPSSEDENHLKLKTQYELADTDHHEVTTVAKRIENASNDNGEHDAQDRSVTPNRSPSNPNFSISKFSPNNSSPDQSSSLSSKVSNNGEVIELEAQGILIHDHVTKLPTHSIWTIRPFTFIELELSIPENLINLLGFGSEIFEGYLINLQEMGITDEERVPQPKTILCRICETYVPAWFIEKHSDLCIVEHRINEELQNFHDAIADQRQLILRISESLWYQQHDSNSPSISSATSPIVPSNNNTILGLGVNSPASAYGSGGNNSSGDYTSPNSSSTSISSVSNSSASSNGLIYEYKGIPLPSMGLHESSGPISSSSSSPRLTSHALNKSGSSVQSILQSKKFPFGILQRLVELCDEALQINPAERSEDSGILQFSPNTEKAITSVVQWRVFEISDLAIRSIVEDTQSLVNDKIDTLSRLISILQYSDKIKAEVDELVLKTVKTTVFKIREKQQQQDQQQRHHSRTSSNMSKKSSFYFNESNRLPQRNDSSYDDVTIGENVILGSALSLPSSDNGSVPGDGNANDQTLSEPINLSRTTSNANSGVIHSPQPSRTRSPSTRLFQEPYLKEPESRPLQSITPKDILLRGRTTPVDIPRSGSNISMSSKASSLSGHNSRHNSRDINLIDSFHDLELSKKSSEILSNSSSFSSPRRHLSPAPYVEKQNLSSFQRNTNSRFDASSPMVSPSLQHLDIPSDSLAPGPSPAPPTIHQTFSERRTNSGGSANSSNSHSNHLSISTNPNLKSAGTKPPLSPLLVSSTPTSKPSTGSIKDYEVLKAISKGAFGSVFLAKRKLTGDYVAIKCLKKRDMIAKNQILNVKSERAVMMKQSDSPYVAQLYCSFQTRDYLYLVMEYLNGGDCSTLLKVLGTLGNEWAKRYIAEVVVGITDLHKRGIIHRDLKPDNLLIDSKGHLKLTDFGLSRIGVLGRQNRQHRKSSTSEQGIEIFRRNLNQGFNNQSPLANVSGTGHGNMSGGEYPLPESYSGHNQNHRRNNSVTPFSLSPTLEYSKLASSHSQQSSAHPSNLQSSLSNPGSGHNSHHGSTSGAAMLTSPPTGFSDVFSYPMHHGLGQQQKNPTPPPQPASSNIPTTSRVSGTVGQLPSNRSNSFLKHGGSGSGRTGSGSSSLDSPMLKPSLPRTSSESSFAIVDDDFQVSPSQHPHSITSFALFDPSHDENSAEVKKFVGTPDYLSPETIEGTSQGEFSDWWSVGCILFEFLFGYPPFHADTPDKVFKNILAGEIDWPPLSPEEEQEICPPSAKDLIKRFLTLDPQERLGNNGADEIMQHPYFKEIDWNNLYDEEPSFIPSLDDPESTDYFDPRGADISHFPKDDSDEENKEGGNVITSTDSGSPSIQASEFPHPGSQTGLLNSAGYASDNLSTPGETPGGTPSGTPGGSKRERRGSKLADPGEFGSFHFRNLNVLEKANKDVINRLKNEHLEHRNSFSSSSSESTTLSRTRGYSFNGSTANSGSPFKRPVSPVANIVRSSSPVKGENDKDNASHTGSIGSSGPTPMNLSLHQQHSNSPSSLFRHERIGSAVSTYSSGDEYPFDLGKSSPVNESFSITGNNQLPLSTTPKVTHRSSFHSLSKQVFNKSVNDLNSPSSSDTEDSKSSALLRVRKRRESSRRSTNPVAGSIINLPTSSSIGINHTPGSSVSSSGTPVSGTNSHTNSGFPNEMDILYCEPIPIVRHTIKRLLEKLGCIVVAVSDGDELIRRATSKVKFDVIFTALKISKVDSIDAVKLIKYTNSINCETPLIAITGFAKEALQSGEFDDVLEKPIDSNQLRQCLNKYHQNEPRLTRADSGYSSQPGGRSESKRGTRTSTNIDMSASSSTNDKNDEAVEFDKAEIPF